MSFKYNRITIVNLQAYKRKYPNSGCDVRNTIYVVLFTYINSFEEYDLYGNITLDDSKHLMEVFYQ